MESDSRVKLVRMVIMMGGWQVMVKLKNFFVRLSFYRKSMEGKCKPFVQLKQVTRLPDNQTWHLDEDQESCKKQQLQPSSLDCKMLGDSKVERQAANSPLLGTCKDTFVTDGELVEALMPTALKGHQLPLASHSSLSSSCLNFPLLVN